MAPLALIAAMARRRVIGHEGQLPWHVPEDLRFFKATTLEHAIIMGRKTYESTGRPLPRRRNIVVSRRPGFVAPGCEVTANVDEAIALARQTDPQPFVIGGGAIYREALPQVTRMYLTFIDRDVPGDAFFPEYDADAWQETERRAGAEPDVVYVVLDRKTTVSR